MRSIPRKCSRSAFDTDDPSVRFLTFELETEVRVETALVVRAVARGNCEANIAEQTIGSVYLDRIDVFDGDQPIPHYGVQHLRPRSLTIGIR